MISTEQASEALRQVADTEQRSRSAYRYGRSAPFCFVWGSVWMLGYGGEAFASLLHPPGMWPGMWMAWWWMALSLAGAAASILIGRAQSHHTGTSGWRFGMLFLILWLYIFASFVILHPHNDRQVGAVIPLLFGAIYAATGLWLGLRYILIGAFVALSTLCGYFLLPAYFFLWMAVLGGGSLILTGFWLRRI